MGNPPDQTYFIINGFEVLEYEGIELVNDENEATQIIGLLEKPWFD